MVDSAISTGAVDAFSGKVWLTLITKIKYLPGLLTLDYSLKRVGSKYPLVAIYTDTFEEEGHRALDTRGIPKQRVRHLEPSIHVDYSNDPRFYDCWTKLACFSLTQYERVVLLDSDMLVLQNMDELMRIDLDPPSMEGKGNRVFAASHACICNPLKKSHYPSSWTHENCAFTPHELEPERAQVIGPPTTAGVGMVNSGLLALEPSEGAYQQILDKMQEPDAIASYQFPDQALVSDVFKDRWVPLPYVYNALKTMRTSEHRTFWKDDKIKNLHLLLSPKPWEELPGQVTNDTHELWKDWNRKRLEDEKAAGVHD